MGWGWGAGGGVAGALAQARVSVCRPCAAQTPPPPPRCTARGARSLFFSPSHLKRKSSSSASALLPCRRARATSMWPRSVLARQRQSARRQEGGREEGRGRGSRRRRGQRPGSVARAARVKRARGGLACKRGAHVRARGLDSLHQSLAARPKLALHRLLQWHACAREGQVERAGNTAKKSARGAVAPQRAPPAPLRSRSSRPAAFCSARPQPRTALWEGGVQQKGTPLLLHLARRAQLGHRRFQPLLANPAVRTGDV